MDIINTLRALGGMTGLELATQTMGMDYIFCPNNNTWYTEQVWHSLNKPELIGYSLQKILSLIPLDATHSNGSLIYKIDDNARAYKWEPLRSEWLYVGWVPKSELEPLD